MTDVGHWILLGGIPSWYSGIGPLHQDSSDYVSEAQLNDEPIRQKIG